MQPIALEEEGVRLVAGDDPLRRDPLRTGHFRIGLDARLIDEAIELGTGIPAVVVAVVARGAVEVALEVHLGRLAPGPDEGVEVVPLVSRDERPRLEDPRNGRAP